MKFVVLIIKNIYIILINIKFNLFREIKINYIKGRFK